MTAATLNFSTIAVEIALLLLLSLVMLLDLFSKRREQAVHITVCWGSWFWLHGSHRDRKSHTHSGYEWSCVVDPMAHS